RIHTTCLGEIGSISKCRKCIAITGLNISWSIGYRSIVDGYREGVLGIFTRSVSFSVHIYGLSSSDLCSGFYRIHSASLSKVVSISKSRKDKGITSFNISRSISYRGVINGYSERVFGIFTGSVSFSEHIDGLSSSDLCTAY